MTPEIVSVQQMAAHVRRLARHHAITIGPVAHRCTCGTCPFNPEGGEALTESREVNIPPVTTAARYAVALHEIGHIVVDDEGRGYGPDEPSLAFLDKYNAAVTADYVRALGNERDAWDWAEAHALTWTPEMAAKRTDGLASYQEGLDEASDLPNPFGLLKMSVSNLAVARAFARQRIREVGAQVAREEGLDGGAWQRVLEREWAAFDARPVAEAA